MSNIWWLKFVRNGLKIVPKLGFVTFLSLDHKFSLKLNTVIAYDKVWHLVEKKPSKQIFEPKFGPNEPNLARN